MDPAVIRMSVPCQTCGYDLLGLDVTGKCPECGTDVVRSSPECPRCAATHGRRTALTPMPEMPGAWSCAACHGLGFSKGFMQRALQAERVTASERQRQQIDLASHTAVMCGHCRVPTTSLIVNGSVMIDRCRECGFVWLDEHELAAVAAYVASVVGDRPVPGDVEKVLHDPVALRKALARDSKDGSAAENVIYFILSLIMG